MEVVNIFFSIQSSNPFMSTTLFFLTANSLSLLLKNHAFDFLLFFSKIFVLEHESIDCHQVEIKGLVLLRFG